MELHWIDVTDMSFNTLLLLERVQLSWFPGWVSEPELAIALRANPVVEWYLRHKCPEIIPWLDSIITDNAMDASYPTERIRQAELKILNSINDLIVYAVDPSIYDSQPFLGWDPNELLCLADFTGKTVIDIGSGTGKLAMIAAEKAAVVFAVDPVSNLRSYLKEKSRSKGLDNIFPVDGVINSLPFPDQYTDIVMGGHVFGDTPEASYAEMSRVTRPGGTIILCPGTSMNEVAAHEFLVAQGFGWSAFKEPGNGMVRKYWKNT
jgi:SAM-dependent methyltransferase